MVSARQRDEIDKLYKTSRWRKLRPVVIARDFGLCQECKRRGIITKGTIVHHKIEARDDLNLFWNEENLELACAACHNKEHPERSGGTKKPKRKVNVVKFYATNER
ncbi:HNH endonuclease signature motif containing protein [uncultured Enterococcus sp.]|uniref:HNH endonuclease signature motif containing protein n=1 Tax=uncultured Enterococcus sp. TaxID=167972 RepID=UPI002AA7EC3C|nr:HNH endonuclease signature motif containing protein [uncultured Enterococcus sp.]